MGDVRVEPYSPGSQRRGLAKRAPGTRSTPRRPGTPALPPPGGRRSRPWAGSPRGCPARSITISMQSVDFLSTQAVELRIRNRDKRIMAPEAKVQSALPVRHEVLEVGDALAQEGALLEVVRVVGAVLARGGAALVLVLLEDALPALRLALHVLHISGIHTASDQATAPAASL
eukprot:3825101-Pyramimonas_sp.AAC.1